MLPFKIALQFLKYSLTKTIVTLLAVSLGIAIFYFILDASSGLKSTVLSTTAENDAHIRIQTDVAFVSFSEQSAIDLRNDIFKLDNRIVDVSFSYRTTIVLQNANGIDNVIEMRGVDFDYGAKIVDIKKRILHQSKNKFPEPVSDNSLNYDGEIAVGQRFTENSNNPYGLSSILSVKNALGEIFRLKIVAVFISDQDMLSSSVFFTDIETAQKINHASHINFIEIRTKDPVKSNDVAPKISAFSENRFTEFIVSDWQDGNQYIINLLYIEDVSIFLIQIMTGFAVAFGVGSVLMFQVKEKINQIGILKALGLKDKETVLIFLYQALIITIIGLISGLILGFSLSQLFMKVFIRPSGVPLVSLQTDFINLYSLLTFVIMLPTNLLAAFIPIRFVKNLKIIEVIKHE
ncbi:MAG: FtsX-like permease family protein [Acholeplasmataceae bacterium]